MDNLFQKLMLGGSTAALMATMPAVAFAQDTGGDIEQVVVSASRVTIAGYQQPTPVTVVGAAQLEKDAYANIQDAVRELPQVQSPPASFGASQGAGSPGTAGLNVVNLRNLGSLRTLILFDSQRVVVSNLSGGVDITTLPTAVVQRVDIVTGGASASWGSDAVAGVVNFILNKNFTGWKSSVEASDTYNGLNRSMSINSAWGDDVFGGRGHIILAGNVNMRPDTTLMVNEQWFKGAYWVSNPAYNATTNASVPQLIVANDVGQAGGNQGGIIISSPAGSAGAAANALRGIEFVGAGIPQLVNFGNVTLGALSNGGSLTGADSEMPFQTISGANNTYTFFGYGRYKITDTIQASVQLNYGYFTGKGTAQTFQSLGSNGIVIKSDNAFIPSAVKAAMTAGGITSFVLGLNNSNNYPSYGVTGENFNSLAAQGIGPALTFNHRKLERAVFTLEGTLGEDWSWNTYYEHGAVRFWVRLGGGDVLKANLVNAYDAVAVTTANRGTSNLPLGSIVCRSSLTPGTAFTFSGITATSGCIPADPFGWNTISPAAVHYANVPDGENELLQEDVAEASMSGTLPWQLPAGPIGVAFGVDYRKEAGKNTGASPFGALGGFATANYSNFPSSSYNVMEGFAELDVPILKNNIVNSMDAQLAGRMTSYSTSGLVETWKIGLSSQVTDDIKLRALTSIDIRAPQIQELFIPSSVNTGSSTDPKTGQPVNLITNVTGNPNLNPEVGRTYSGGVVLTPTFIDGFSFSADWFAINVTGEITTVATGTILTQCNPSMPSVIYPGTKGNPNDPLCTHLVFDGPNGSLLHLNNSGENVVSQTVSGLDLQANYTMDFWEGNIAWTAFANLQDENTLNGTALGQGLNDSAGQGGTPKWKGVLSADYTTGPVSFTVQTRWYGSSKFTNVANTGNLSSAAVANLYDPAHFEVPFTAYLDFRTSYKWNDNIQLYGAVDNATNTPPPLMPPISTGIQSNGVDIATNTTTYDLLGRTFRLGVRFNY
jgi:outer membrane receptor protein involved in Fe transport